MRKHTFSRRILAMTLSVAMALGGTPLMAVAASPTGMSGEITAFEELPSQTANQELEIGASLSEVILPEMLEATLYTESSPQEEETTVATTSSAIQPENTQDSGETEYAETAVSVPVTWKAEPEFDGDTAGSYVFTPEFAADYTLAAGVEVPFITVEVTNTAISGFFVSVTGGNPVTIMVSGTGWDLDDSGVLTISSDAGMSDWADNGRSANVNSVTSAVIEEGVTAISAIAFFNCTQLTSITIPGSVTDIGQSAFYGCTKLISVAIPEGVTAISPSTFYGCTGLTSVTIPDSVTTIGTNAFSKCTTLTSVSIPNSVTTINNFAFSETALTSIVIPENVTTIGQSAFVKCTGLTSVTIPGNVTNLGGYVFYYCSNLETVTFEGETPPAAIGIELLNECDNLAAIYVPADSVDLYKAVPSLEPYIDFIITEPVSLHVRTDSLDLIGNSLSYRNSGGSLTTVDPTAADITDTAEGWAWYLHANTALGYPAKTLVLNGIAVDTTDQCGIRIPTGSAIVLADGSRNDVATSYVGAAYGVISGGTGTETLTIKGNGEFHITSGGASTTKSSGLYVWGNLVLESGTIYSKVNGSDISNLVPFYAINFDSSLKAYQNSGSSYNLPASWGPNATYIYNNGVRATDIKLVNGAFEPSAVVTDKTVYGVTGAPVSEDNTVTITLTNDTFSGLAVDGDVSGWFTNLPQGITAKVESLDLQTEITVAFAGTPTEVSDASMAITIPADKLESGQALAVTSNGSAKFDIAAEGERNDFLNLVADEITYRNTNGVPVSKNPSEENITDTSEGWKWYRSESGSYAANTLVLTGTRLESGDAVAISLPEDSTVVLENSSNNTVRSLYEGIAGSFGICGDGDLTFKGSNGILTVTGGYSMNNGSPSAGIGAMGSVTIQGGSITSSGWKDSQRSYGIYSAGPEASDGVFIEGGEVIATGGNATLLSCGIYSESAVRLSGGTIYARSGEVSGENAKTLAIYAVSGITDTGMSAFQLAEDTYTAQVSVSDNSGAFYSYVYDENSQTTDIKIMQSKNSVSNMGGTAAVTYSGAAVGLAGVSGLFTVDSNAGAVSYSLEAGEVGYTGVGTLTNGALTVTRAGVFKIGLTTAATQTHAAGVKVIATLTVDKGAKARPAGISSENATTGNNDGRLVNLTPGTVYEYKLVSASAYTAAAANESGEITGLPAGEYQIRFAATDLYSTSDSATIAIRGGTSQSGGKSVTGITIPAGANIPGESRTINATVANSVTSQTIAISVSEGASWALYSDSACTREITSKTMTLSVGSNTAYIKVTAENGTSQVYTLTITRQSSSGGGSPGGSSNNGSSGSGGNVSIPVTGGSENKAAVDSKGNASTTVTDKNIADAIANARASAAKQGKSAGEITVSINVSMGGKDAGTVTVNLPRATQQQLISNKISAVELTIDRPAIVMGLNNAAITEINRQANADVQLSAAKTDSAALGTAARNAIGSRPAFDFKASYQSGKGSVTDFGKGTVFVRIPYTPAAGEKVGYLYAVYVDGKGNISRVPGSAYDANTKSIIFVTNHFSVYGVSYTDPTARFTDISSNRVRESIDYVVGRGLLTGTSETTFAPETAITCGILVTALGRLAGADVSSYKTGSFTDVKAGSTFQPYIEWAYKKGIIQGVGNNQFAPDRAVTREEIAAILQNYAKVTGYTLPVTREATAYEDASSIGGIYKTAVTAMQQAGIMMGGSGSKFNPKSSATRAEVSTMLHRYIKLTIDPATAQGWALNDAGQYLYYKDSKALTGTQTIDDVKYFFETTGVLKTGWVKDGGNWRFYSGNTMLVGFWDIGANSGSKTYYFTRDGIMVAGKWLEIDGKRYYFYADGSLARSTKIDDYEVDENGVRKTK